MKAIIDGRTMEIRKGETILELARRAGKNIPTLCHDERLKPFGSCWVCVVEVEGRRGFVPACATEVTDGMKIRTETPAILETRKMCLELLSSIHYGDCFPPCRMTCPAGIDIQGYIAHIANNRPEAALALIKERNPLPLVIGRVCTRPCEDACRRNIVDERVSINWLKRFCADLDMMASVHYVPERARPTGKRVAIIGSGPAGLSCAYYLGVAGHETTIFEAEEKPGGMLRYGIPEYRLPKKILDIEISRVLELDSKLECGKRLGRDFTIADLFEDGYDAVFLGTGAWKSQSMRCEGENLPGVLSGIDFLEDIGRGKKPEISGRVAVIGGGNTAMDVARTCIRLGARVTVLYRRTEKEMPANRIEIEEAREEGVNFQFLVAPEKITIRHGDSQNGKAGSCLAIELVRMELGEPDSSGRRSPVPVKGSNFIMEFEHVFAAIGQKPDLSFLPEGESKEFYGRPGYISRTKWGTVEVDPLTFETGVKGVYAAGDNVNGAATAIEAIAGGRKAAKAIDGFLRNRPYEYEKPLFSFSRGRNEEIEPDYYRDVRRVKRNMMPVLKPEERKNNFSEIELGYSRETALAEARRCLECGCQDVYECKLKSYCEEYAVDLEAYRGEIKKTPAIIEHPYIVRDKSKCILCGRCVRICLEQERIGVWGFVKRGFDTYVAPALEKPLEAAGCDSCGSCISTCPVGALTPKTPAAKPGPFECESTLSVCTLCGHLCDLYYNSVVGELMNVKNIPSSELNSGNLCKKGYFDFVFKNSGEELSGARTGVYGEKDSREIAVREALREAATLLRNAGSGASIAFIASPAMTNEEYYCLGKIARVALGSNNLESGGEPSKAPLIREFFGRACSPAGRAEILNADFILNAGSDLRTSAPVAYHDALSAMERGAFLASLTPSSTLLGRKSSLEIVSGEIPFHEFLLYMISRALATGCVKEEEIAGRNRNNSVELEKIKKAISALEFSKFAGMEKEVERVLEKWQNSKKPVLVVVREELSCRELSLILSLGVMLGAISNSWPGVVFLTKNGNTVGMEDMGFDRRVFPGQADVSSEETINRFEALWHSSLRFPESGKLDGNRLDNMEVIVVYGTAGISGNMLEAIKRSRARKIVFSPFNCELSKIADILLPLVPPYRSAGTMTNFEDKLVLLSPVSGSGNENIMLLAQLARLLSELELPSTAADVFAEIEKSIPDYAGAGRYLKRWPWTLRRIIAEKVPPVLFVEEKG